MLIEQRSMRTGLRYSYQPIYDRQQVTAAASQTMNYFKSISDGLLSTNMTNAGSLGDNKHFFLEGISIHAEGAVPIADLVKLFDYSYVEIKFSGLDLFTGPLFLLPDCGGLYGSVATTASTTTLQSFVNGKTNKPYYDLSMTDKQGKPVALEINKEATFSCQIKREAATAISAAFYLWVVLHGILGRQ